MLAAVGAGVGEDMVSSDDVGLRRRVRKGVVVVACVFWSGCFDDDI